MVSYLSGKIATSLELFEEGRHEEGWEEQDGRPEENVWGVGAMMATCRPNEVALQTDALLQRFRGYIRTKRPKRTEEKTDQKAILSKLSDRQEESTKKKHTIHKKRDKALVCTVTHTAVKG